MKIFRINLVLTETFEGSIEIQAENEEQAQLEVARILNEEDNFDLIMELHQSDNCDSSISVESIEEIN